MAATALGTLLQHVRRSMLRHHDAGHTDGTLLECFITQHDEIAFEALVRRHGPMVLGVCRRVLRNEADAEDAFQATFLVLVRRAGSIRPRGMVGNWLYGVAQNTARKAKAMNTRMRAREREAGARPRPEPPSEDWRQQQVLLDQELQALPDKYRAPIVLCDLEGKSIKEAARHLGCPAGTIGTRLARGRSMLARRLACRGLTLSGGIATVLSLKEASASVPLPLVTSTVKAASLFAAGQAASGVVGVNVTALTEGVLKAMLLTKLKTATVVLLVIAALGAGAAFQSYTARAVEPANPGWAEAVKDTKPENADRQPAAQEEALNSQIANVLKAHGGEQKLRNLKTFTMRVKISCTSQKQEHHFFIHYPEQARVEMKFDKFLGFQTPQGTILQNLTESHRLVIVRNGGKRWKKVNGGEATEDRGGAEEALKFIGPRAMLRLKDPAMTVSLLGERMAGDNTAILGDRAAICVGLARRDGKKFLPLHALMGMQVNEVRLYFDKDSGLLLKEEWGYGDTQFENFFTDYKVFNGIPVAQKIVERTNREVIYRTEVEFNIVDKLDVNLFQKP